MVTNNINKQDNRQKGKTIQVMALSFSVVAGAVISFVVVMKFIDRTDAIVTFVQDNLVVSLAGSCAFYVVVFILMKWVVQSFMNHSD